MNASDKVRALSDVHAIFIAPFNRFMVSVKVSHFCIASIAYAICFFLVPVGVIARITAYLASARLLSMDQLPMRPFARPRNFCEAGISQRLQQITYPLGHS